MEQLLLTAEVAGAIMGIFTFLCFIVRPIRDRIFGLGDIREGMKCQLRSDMLRIYYRHREQEEIRQYEYENFLACYKAYKALWGNSFIDKIYKEIQTWEVKT